MANINRPTPPFKKNGTTITQRTTNNKVSINDGIEDVSLLSVLGLAQKTLTGTTEVNSSTTVVGVNTLFLSELAIGDMVAVSTAPSTWAYVTAIASNTSMTVSISLGNGTSQAINALPCVARVKSYANHKLFFDYHGTLILGDLVSVTGNSGVLLSMKKNNLNDVVQSELTNTGNGLNSAVLQSYTSGMNNLRIVTYSPLSKDFSGITTNTQDLCLGVGASLDVKSGYTLRITNTSINLLDNIKLVLGTGLDGEIYVNADDLYISNITQDKDIIFSGNDGGVQTTIMSLDVSAGQLSGIQKAVAGVMTNATAGTDYQLPIFEKTGTVITTKVDKDNIRLTGELETNKKIHIKTDDIPVNSSSSSPASLEYGLTIGESADTGLNITTGGNDTGLRTQNIDVKQYLNIFDGDTLGLYDEFLSDTNDFSTANWEFFGDMGVDGTNAKFIFSTGYGLVRQLYTNFDSPVDFMMCEAEIVVDSNTLNDSAKVKILFGNNLFVKLKVGINKFFIRSGMAINTYPFAIEVTDVTSGELVISEMSVKKSLLCEMHLNGYLRLYDAVTYELLEGMVKSDKEWGLIGATANTDYLAPTNIKNASFAIYDNGNSGATKTIDWANGNVQKVTMTDNCNFSFSNPVAGSTYKLYLIQDAGGTNTHTWTGGGLVIKWNKNTEPVWITTGDAVNIAIIDYDGTTYRGDGWNPS